MAYISAQDVKKIRVALKAAFPEFKFGVRKSIGGVDVTVVSGPLDLFEDCYHGEGYGEINHYHLGNYTNSDFYKAIDFIIRNAGKQYYYNNSDTKIDYFDVAFYYNIDVGSWSKPYEIKFPKKGIYHIPNYQAEAETAVAVNKIAA